MITGQPKPGLEEIGKIRPGVEHHPMSKMKKPDLRYITANPTATRVYTLPAMIPLTMN